MIAYIQLNYTDRLFPEKQSIYFAFLFEATQKDNLERLVECIRCFLSFRYDLKLRIEKDFNGNLFGKRAEATWCSDWLSLEKAGAHTDSSEISRLLKRVDFKSNNIMEILFPADCTTAEKANAGVDESAGIRKEIIYRFIYNINISMYYRAAISYGDGPFSAVDDIIISDSQGHERYYRVEDVLKFSRVSEEKILYGTGEHSDDSAMESINQAILFGKTSKIRNGTNKLTGGIPRKKTLTIRRRYLQAFLLDILHNAQVYGNGPTRIYLEPKQGAQMYLVVCNEVFLDKGTDLEKWCLRKNYELKQAAEFDHATDPNAKKGMSLGCIAHCMKDYGGMIARYRYQNGKVFFEIKLPIIQQ